jgi:hypothetical protein
VTKKPGRLRVRYRRLIGLLQGESDIRRNRPKAARDVDAIKHCRFALSPVPTPNLFIIGDVIAYEGMKRGGTGGFEMTHCETDPVGLQKMIEQFDLFFEESHKETLRLHPTTRDLGKQLQKFYDEAESEMQKL